MRIDMLLNKLCLTKSRSIAKIACDKGLVSLNGKTAKASAEVKEGDIIQFHLYGYEHQIRIDKIPQGNVAKKDATNYYTLLSRKEISN
ncbi:MAG TPA: S4 domain-containing protein [Candidatus Syntrophosphaera thermopropionivorans]|jgi:ribosomal 50S subunit-recycling heat shock protein|uniref:RNA-binding protein n=1 Tax=Candidatus Syntrophosphaera thermopropionivorans TaxID=2593015 RepID=A0AC61QL57_9BACT|nr:S4 domain-containing protein [Candidatus Syntrophosphaera thermopropionivorans]MBP7899279.1 RNA-binding protein [Candidatus Syntrophosphaera sp.]NLA45344.1 RNA-binding protein [Candidatus Cloacimonadota bacterium]MBP7932704.1 RNA-binding protein [Candidatus Syntrophosphaera sp.]MBP9006473.1 RNA-binding protein [Candidatus Syntrophosphaera sp.]TDF74714.1 RNA-binding protein [Candidatus Syntrophosphaera thermopropionivorans]